MAGAAVLVGADKLLIKEKFRYFLENKISLDRNPYGDGLSSVRVVDRLLELVKQPEIASS